MTHDAVSVAAMLLLAAFALERISRGLLFLLDSFHAWQAKFPDPSTAMGEEARADAMRRQQWAYFVVCGLLGFFLVLFGSEFRVLSAMGITNQPFLDTGMTWLVLVAGSDRIREILGDGGSSPVQQTSTPIRVEGTVTLVPGTGGLDAQEAGAAGRESVLRVGR